MQKMVLVLVFVTLFLSGCAINNLNLTQTKTYQGKILSCAKFEENFICRFSLDNKIYKANSVYNYKPSANLSLITVKNGYIISVKNILTYDQRAKNEYGKVKSNIPLPENSSINF